MMLIMSCQKIIFSVVFTCAAAAQPPSGDRVNEHPRAKRKYVMEDLQLFSSAECQRFSLTVSVSVSVYLLIRP